MELRLCSSLLSIGYCPVESCGLNHTVKFCEPCSHVYVSMNDYEEHVRGARHAKSLKASRVNVFCTTCNRNLTGYQWSEHILGTKHANLSTSRGIATDIEPTEGNPPDGFVHCALCNVNVRVWDKHQAGDKHQRKQQYFSLKAVFDIAASDKNGVTVSPQDELDFGVVDLPVARLGVEGSLVVQLSDVSACVKIIRVKLYAVSMRKNPLFTTTTKNDVVTSNNVSSIDVHFALKNRGLYEDRAEIVFQNLITLATFVIVRPILVIVGNQVDQDTLKPAIPYAPKKPTSHEVKRIVGGVALPKAKLIPWKVELPLAEIPKPLPLILDLKIDILEIFKLLESHDDPVLTMPGILDSTTHRQYFKMLLWIEEVQLAKDMEIYDMSGITLRAQGNSYFLRVLGLAEKRPSVILGDSVLVQPTNARDKCQWFEGIVHVIEQLEIGIRFRKSSTQQHPGQTFNVKFRYNRIAMRRQHQALESNFVATRVLCPTLAHATNARPFFYMGPVYNPLINDNPAQTSAVKLAVSQPPGAMPFIIFGPPGTGKTVTVIECMRQLLRDPKVRILACAPSNAAADVLALRLIGHLNTKELLRFYAPSRLQRLIPPELVPYSVSKAGHFAFPGLDTMNTFRVVICTCISASVFHGAGMASGHFSHIFIDEAAQATEPEVMVPIKTMANHETNIILSGDPLQLGPIVRSKVALERNLGRSFLKRLMENEVYNLETQKGISIVKLVKNFRSHEAIIDFPSKTFYNGELEACGNSAVIDAFIGRGELLPNPKFPVVFHAIPGEDLQEDSSPSFFNIHEITQVRVYVELVLSLGLCLAEEIGIITPYRAQAAKLRQALKPFHADIKVGSVEEYQGQERKVIIISTVRSSRKFVEHDLRHGLGFVADPRRFNVAVTRAKAALIIVGDPTTLSLDHVWRKFLNFVHKCGGWAGDEISWDPDAPVDENEPLDKLVRAAAITKMQESAMRVSTIGDLMLD